MGPWLTTIGLLLDIVGVWILARGVIMTNERAKTLAATRWKATRSLRNSSCKGRVRAALASAFSLLASPCR